MSVSFTACTEKQEKPASEEKTSFELVSDFIQNYKGISNVNRISDENLIKSKNIQTCITTTTETIKSDDYVLWEVSNVADEVTVLFVFDHYVISANLISEDTKLVNENMLVDAEFMDFSDEQNYQNGGFAWKESETAYALLNGEAGYDCSSIWAYDDTQKTSH